MTHSGEPTKKPGTSVKRPPPDDWTEDQNLDKVNLASIDRDWPADHEVERGDERLGGHA
jgi:hypothetical protein